MVEHVDNLETRLAKLEEVFAQKDVKVEEKTPANESQKASDSEGEGDKGVRSSQDELNEEKFDNIRSEQTAVRNMLKLFDGKIKTMKEKYNNFQKDFAGWTINQTDTDRKTKQLESRLSQIEEQQEELDLSDLEGKQEVKVADIIKSMQTL